MMSAAFRLGVASGAFLLFAATAAPAAQPNIREGLWEITMKMEMEGMPGGGRPPQTMQHCVTPKDLQNPAAMDRGMDKSSRCEMTDYRLQGNTATWKMVCKGEGAMTGTGTATYSGTSYTMITKMAMTQGGKAMNMTMSNTGKYLGPCKK
jgi:hypothetical protein